VKENKMETKKREKKIKSPIRSRGLLPPKRKRKEKRKRVRFKKKKISLRNPSPTL